MRLDAIRNTLGTLASALLAVCMAGPAAGADAFPTRPVRIVVPAAPGGGLDITARLVAQKMSERLGQQVIVENRSGGDTLLGTRQVKDAAPDGYTLLGQANGFTALPALKVDPGFDPVKHFTGIGFLLRAANVMWVPAASPDQSARDFVARARANPGKLTYAHGGLGSPLHLSAAMFVREGTLDVLPVPYKGAGAIYPDLIAGRVDTLFASYTGGAGHLQGGRLRAVAVTGAERLAALPHVPTLREQGIPMEFYLWLGLFAPAGTPPDVVQRLHEALKYATTSRELGERFRSEGSEVPQLTPQEFNQYIARETVETARLMRELNVQKE